MNVYSADPNTAVNADANEEINLSNEVKDQLSSSVALIQKDKSIEESLSNSAAFKKCKEKFTGGSVLPDECKNLIKNDKATLEELANTFKLNESNGFHKDANYLAVFNYLNERMYSALRGVKDGKETTVVDHKIFYDLYKNQLGKNFILDLSSFCQEKLYGAIIGQSGQGSSNFSYNLADYEKHAGACLEALPCVCNIDSSTCQKSKFASDANFSNLKNKLGSEPSLKNQGCTLTARLKQMREVFAKIDKTKLALTDNDQLKINPNTRSYNRDDKEKGMDSLTGISSKEFEQIQNTSGNNEKVKELNLDCANNDPTKCERIAKTTEERLKDAELEHNLKSEVMIKNVDALASMQEIQEYMEKNNFSKKEIDALMAKNAEDIKAEIKKNLSTERESIIKQMRDELEKTTVVLKKDSTTNSDVSLIKKNLEQYPERMKQLVHYSNVLSYYILGIKEDGAGQKSYMGGLSREVASGESQNAGHADLVEKNADAAYFKQLETKKGEGENKNSLNINSDFINKILFD